MYLEKVREIEESTFGVPVNTGLNLFASAEHFLDEIAERCQREMLEVYTNVRPANYIYTQYLCTFNTCDCCTYGTQC